jgi:hypothetical protein
MWYLLPTFCRFAAGRSYGAIAMAIDNLAIDNGAPCAGRDL